MDELDPNWLKQKVDLGGKTKSLSEKNQARSQLAGAPLLVGQLGALEFRQKMLEGDGEILNTLRLSTQGTVAEVLR